jgi:aminoglycoside phosphotransferase family enzyme/predicted kinase
MSRHEPAPLDWQDAGTLRRVRAALRARPFRKDRTSQIQMVQTHISTVFLTSRYVFKFKRPANFGFVDFRALRSRLHFCKEELRLNSRLAKDVYLEVVPLRANAAGALTFDKRGNIVDYAVLMRRLPKQEMLDARLHKGQVGTTGLDTLAATIARFHGKLRATQADSSYGSIDTWIRNWKENFEQTLPEVGETLPMTTHQSIYQRVFAFLDSSRNLIEARVTGGFIRNGHGDLRCEHIQLGDPIRIIDCVEFNERFRIGDVANDLAFLLMDLCAFKRPDLARRVLELYRNRTGDKEMRALIPFYACYRAFVRGKVLGMRLRDRNLSPEVRSNLLNRAWAFFALSDAFARQMGPPAMILVSGLMGTGKSTLAATLAVRTGATVISSDRTRKELAGISLQTRDLSTFGAGLYSDAWTERTYGTIFDRTRELLRNHTSVILDATFSKRSFRKRAFALAKEMGAEPFVVECVAPDKITLARLTSRERIGMSTSDGRAELYAAQKDSFEPMSEIPGERHCVARTDRMMEDTVRNIMAMPGLHIPDPLFTLPEDGLATTANWRTDSP